MATQLEKRLANIESRVVVADARDPRLVALIMWLCGIDGKPLDIETVPTGVTIGEFIKSCSGTSLPIKGK